MLFNFSGLREIRRCGVRRYGYSHSYFTMLLVGMSSASAFAGEVLAGHQSMNPEHSTVFNIIKDKTKAGEICGTDNNLQNWHQLQKENSKALKQPHSLTNQIKQRMQKTSDNAAMNGNGVPGRYYIPVVVHVYGDRYNCDTGNYCLTEQKIIDGLNKTNEDFRGLITDDGPISAEFQAIRENLNIEFVLAKK